MLVTDQLLCCDREYGEWGDPAASEEVHRYIQSYAPYDNIRQATYPHMLLTAGGGQRGPPAHVSFESQHMHSTTMHLCPWGIQPNAAPP
jgi:prolyl oligopeptidase PreP (S9A serine peptidase family)